jgi:hypothetical protein
VVRVAWHDVGGDGTMSKSSSSVTKVGCASAPESPAARRRPFHAASTGQAHARKLAPHPVRRLRATLAHGLSPVHTALLSGGALAPTVHELLALPAIVGRTPLDDGAMGNPGPDALAEFANCVSLTALARGGPPAGPSADTRPGADAGAGAGVSALPTLPAYGASVRSHGRHALTSMVVRPAD